MKKQPYILLSITILLLAACSHPNEGIQIYNPKGWALDVTVNNKLHVIGGDAAVNLPAQGGTFDIKATYQGKVLIDTVIELTTKQVQRGILLNLSRESLYRVGQDYRYDPLEQFREYLGDDMQARMDSTFDQQHQMMSEKEGETIVQIDTMLFMGDIKEYPPSQVVIEREWDVEPQYAFPEEIEITVRSESDKYKGSKLYKVFSKARLLQYYGY